MKASFENGFYETAHLLVRCEVFGKVGGVRDWLLDGQARVARTRRLGGRASGRGGPLGEDTLFAWEARRTGARTALATDLLAGSVEARCPLF